MNELTKEQAKNVYAEGLQVGIELGKRLVEGGQTMNIDTMVGAATQMSQDFDQFFQGLQDKYPFSYESSDFFGSDDEWESAKVDVKELLRDAFNAGCGSFSKRIAAAQKICHADGCSNPKRHPLSHHCEAHKSRR